MKIDSEHDWLIAEEELKKSVMGLAGMYDVLQEGRVGFSFRDKDIEISSELFENSEHELITDILKAFSMAEKSIRCDVSHEKKIMLHMAAFGGVYSNGQNSSNANPVFVAERIAAQQAIDEARLIADRQSVADKTNIFNASKWRAVQLVRVSNMLSDESEPTEALRTNKQSEQVHVRSIVHKGLEVGSIEYLDDGEQVTLIRSDVNQEHQNKGIGFSAYKALIAEKMREGKKVCSDAILYPQAIRIYEKLEKAGFGIKSNETRMMVGYRRTTLSREDISSQRNSFPTIYVQGAGITEPGYRLKGEPVFEVISCPSAFLKHKEYEIAEIDKHSGKEVVYRVSKDRIAREMKSSLNGFDSDAINLIKSKVDMAINSLISPENDALSKAISQKDICAWESEVVLKGELQIVLEKVNASEMTLK